MLITYLKSVSQIEEKQQMAHVVMSIEIPKCGLAYCLQRPSIYNSKSIINGGSAQTISETFPNVKNGMIYLLEEACVIKHYLSIIYLSECKIPLGGYSSSTEMAPEVYEAVKSNHIH